VYTYVADSAVKALLGCALHVEGSGRVVVVEILDALCPYCSLMLAETLDALRELATAGKIRLAVCEMLVHGEESLRVHAAVRCLPPERRLDALKAFMLRGEPVPAEPCPEGEGAARACDAAARAAGAVSTPSLVVYNEEGKIGRLYRGYMSLDSVLAAIAEVSAMRARCPLTRPLPPVHEVREEGTFIPIIFPLSSHSVANGAAR